MMADQINPMAAAVIERCEIQPSSGAAAELTLPLLHFDITWLYFHPVQRLLFFEFPSSKSQFLQTIVPNLKQSLAQTLNHFLPLAGNIVHPLDAGRPFTRYLAGDSVSLTIAECNKDFKHLTGNHPRVADEFYACVPRLRSPTHTPNAVVFPVLALQVTLFPDQGLCLGYTNHHAIGDASSIVRFIKAWASFTAVGSKPIDDKSLPYYDRTHVQDPNGLDTIYWDQLKRSRPVESPPIKFPLNRVRATFVITKDDVEKLKTFVVVRRPEMPSTAFTVVCALVWVCLVKAEAADVAVADDEPEFFGFAADCRGRLDPPLPVTYFGNCLAFVKAESTHGALTGNEGFMNAVESVRKAIHKAVYNEKGILDGAEHWPVEFGKLIGKRLFGVAGSPRFDLYDADYGWGRPKKFESASIDGDTSMSLCKSRDFEGGLEIGLSRPKKNLDKFAAIFTEALRKL